MPWKNRNDVAQNHAIVIPRAIAILLSSELKGFVNREERQLVAVKSRGRDTEHQFMKQTAEKTGRKHRANRLPPATATAKYVAMQPRIDAIVPTPPKLRWRDRLPRPVHDRCGSKACQTFRGAKRTRPEFNRGDKQDEFDRMVEQMAAGEQIAA